MTGYTDASIVIRVLDGEEREIQAGVADSKNSILTLLLDYPLTVGTQVLTNTDSDQVSLGEVTDWEWDYCGVLVRVHIKILNNFNQANPL
jgi:hypothetical protein